ncbi:restriction endonuclease [Anopheles sinensis]|uniref:Restriction endonuclease n=1 Tax=Anopheles sinensis TaxID=74873 RepID=A0A084WBL1_ANOSI|nr:restriction endonuclease [Anopheles sinensis]
MTMPQLVTDKIILPDQLVTMTLPFWEEEEGLCLQGHIDTGKRVSKATEKRANVKFQLNLVADRWEKVHLRREVAARRKESGCEGAEKHNCAFHRTAAMRTDGRYGGDDTDGGDDAAAWVHADAGMMVKLPPFGESATS